MSGGIESAPLHLGLLWCVATRKPLLFNGPVFGEGYTREISVRLLLNQVLKQSVWHAQVRE
jgi:hypothetical protein